MRFAKTAMSEVNVNRFPAAAVHALNYPYRRAPLPVGIRCRMFNAWRVGNEFNWDTIPAVRPTTRGGTFRVRGSVIYYRTDYTGD
jgi:hypothetical protein